MKHVAILGSGFGLYGYLPAVLEAGAERVLLPERYREKFAGRKELARFADRVNWAADEHAALSLADSVVIALKPDLQESWARHCIGCENITAILLEKPLAASPDVAQRLLSDLESSKKAFRIGYVFRYLHWGQKLMAMLADGGIAADEELRVSWRFRAHHYLHDLPNWKRYGAQGGGALRFYGIHLVALLAECGYRRVLSSSLRGEAGEAAGWEAVFAGTGLPAFHIHVDSYAEVSRFRLEHGRHVLADGLDPFDDPNCPLPENGLDKRVPLLARLCASLQEDGACLYEIYRRSLSLWKDAEGFADEETHVAIPV